MKGLSDIKPILFTMRMSVDDMATLEALAEHTGRSKSQHVKQLLYGEYARLVAGDRLLSQRYRRAIERLEGRVGSPLERMLARASAERVPAKNEAKSRAGAKKRDTEAR